MRTPATKSAVSPPGYKADQATTTGPGDGLLSIHIIDDDAPLGAALSAGLEAFGYRAVFSTSASAGWTVAHSEPPDLILCDINMPGKNGHRFLEEIRGDPELANCQFVFMTGNPGFAHPRKGMDLGADDFLLKPFTLETLVACVEARLRRKEISQQKEAAVVSELRASLHKWLPHEFFTPLTGILGFAEMLDQDIGTMQAAEIRDATRGILQSGQRLHRTLRNYLFALDRLNPDSDAPFPVLSGATVAQQFERGARAAAVRHELRERDLVVELAATPLSGGAQELALLAEELTENAFSFSRPGTPVRVTAQRLGAHLQLTVSDAGRGMTAQQLKAFSVFRQFERPSLEQQGLGLGLFIVRQIVRRLAGQLHIDSRPGHGTTCTVMLPAYAEPPAKGAPVPGRGSR
jgi:signal transduction histidine kinase